MKKDIKMNTKTILVSFLAVVSAMFLVASVSALSWTGDLVDPSSVTVEVDGSVVDGSTIIVVAGETITVKVWFTSLVYDNVRLEAELDGEKVETNAMSAPFIVEKDNKKRAALTIEVPYELKDELSDDITLSIELDGEDHRSEAEPIKLRVSREPYNPDIKSITVSKTVKAGETFPVDIVLKNIGYNDLEDIYVTASIASLGVEQKAYFGDLIALECDDENDDTDDIPYGEDTLDRRCNEDDEDTVAGRLFLKLPYDVKAGVYNVDVVVKNDDSTSKETVQVAVENEFESTVFKSGNSIWIVNPTDSVVGYRIVPESPASVSETIVFVPAGASKQVDVSSNVEGEYDFSVSVFTMKGELVDKISFQGSTGENGTDTNPIVILTVVLAIVFIVLLIVLIVLIGKKPEKSGEFGESYY